MKNKTSPVVSIIGLVSISLLALVCFGCASVPQKSPRELAGVNEDPVERVALTPMIKATPVDVRESLGEAVEKSLSKALERMKIEVVTPVRDATLALTEEEEVKELTQERLRSLGPENERFVLVVFLTDWSSRITFGSTCNMELSGYLIDKKVGRVVWHGKGTGAAGQGGLAGMLFKRWNDKDAVQYSVANLLAGFPRAVPRV